MINIIENGEAHTDKKTQVCVTKTYECMIHFCTFLSEFSFNEAEIFRVSSAIKGASTV